MRKNPFPGRLIVFEGLDGAGTTTQAGKLSDFLISKGIKSYLTREPSQYLIGGLIRSYLAHDWKSSPETLQLLFTADRAYHLNKEVIPLLKKGVWVVCDRYFLSTLAYGFLEIKNKEWLISINDLFINPDLTIFMDVKPSTAMARIKRGRFSVELFEEKRKLEKIRNNYIYFSKKLKNVRFINGEESIEKVFEDIKKLINFA